MCVWDVAAHVVESHDADWIALLEAEMAETSYNLGHHRPDLTGGEVTLWIVGIDIKLHGC